MGSTLILRLAGPLQDWSTDSRFEHRRAENFPTKSGIIGMIANAMGRKRDDDISNLQKIKISVRIDQPGVFLEDFQISKPQEKKDPFVSRRWYLSDAVFLCAIECEDQSLLKKIEAAIKNPKRPLYLGRRSCPPDFPLLYGRYDTDALSALRKIAWTGRGTMPNSLSLYSEGNKGDIIRKRMDQPVSFDFHHRKYRMGEMTLESICLEPYHSQSEMHFEASIDYFDKLPEYKET